MPEFPGDEESVPDSVKPDALLLPLQGCPKLQVAGAQPFLLLV